MFRRLPTRLSRSIAATVGLFACSLLAAQQPPPASEVKPADIKRTQEENKKRYARLTNDILKLALRWEKSDNTADQERAKTLRAVLKLADERGVDNLFKQLVEGINTGANSGELQDLIGKDKKLIAALDEILNTLETEDEFSILQRDIKNIKELIKEVERIKREQENQRARTENSRSDAEKIAKDQNNLAKQTQDLANKMAGKDGKGNANAGKEKDEKAEPKPETKPGEGAPEAKPDPSEGKSDPKDAGDPKGGDPKGGDPKGGDPKGGDPKGGDPKGGDPKGGDPKGGDPKGGDPKAGSSRESPKAGPMGAEAKPGEPKPMTGTPMDPKSGNPMPGEPKAKPGENKSQGEGKGEMKPSDGQSGAEAKPMTQQPMGGQPNSSKPSSGSPPSGSPPSGQPSDSQPPNGQPKNDDAQENVQQAVPQQKGAEQDLHKNDRDNASKKQDAAIQKLEQALKELEKRLKQLREKELAKLLGNLEERITRMLRMQQEVYENTKMIDKTIKKNGQISKSERQRSQIEGDKEDAIIVEADRALKLMEGEGTAVVFAGVLSQVKGDMESVKRRLMDTRVEGRNKADQAEGTQLIEEDIIEQLTMMKEALKKAKQELENQQNKPPMDSNSANKPNQKLIDLINELKLIKSLQEQVNKRTTSYSKQDPGEQAKDPIIQAELKQLSDRQRVLQEMLHKIATEANQ